MGSGRPSFLLVSVQQVKVSKKSSGYTPWVSFHPTPQGSRTSPEGTGSHLLRHTRCPDHMSSISA